MTYFYQISYDEVRDDFYGVVDIIIDKKPVELFTIDSTKEMCQLIQTKVMNHIDDVEGLQKFLVRQEKLDKDDSLILIETPLY